MSLQKLSESIISRDVVEHLDDNKYLYGAGLTSAALLGYGALLRANRLDEEDRLADTLSSVGIGAGTGAAVVGARKYLPSKFEKIHKIIGEGKGKKALLLPLFLGTYGGLYAKAALNMHHNRNRLIPTTLNRRPEGILGTEDPIHFRSIRARRRYNERKDDQNWF